MTEPTEFARARNDVLAYFLHDDRDVDGAAEAIDGLTFRQTFKVVDAVIRALTQDPSIAYALAWAEAGGTPSPITEVPFVPGPTGPPSDTHADRVFADAWASAHWLILASDYEATVRQHLAALHADLARSKLANLRVEVAADITVTVVGTETDTITVTDTADVDEAAPTPGLLPPALRPPEPGLAKPWPADRILVNIDAVRLARQWVEGRLLAEAGELGAGYDIGILTGNKVLTALDAALNGHPRPTDLPEGLTPPDMAEMRQAGHRLADYAARNIIGPNPLDLDHLADLVSTWRQAAADGGRPLDTIGRLTEARIEADIFTAPHADRIAPGSTMGDDYVMVQAGDLRRLATFCASADCGGLTTAEVEPVARLLLAFLADGADGMAQHRAPEVRAASVTIDGLDPHEVIAEAARWIRARLSSSAGIYDQGLYDANSGINAAAALDRFAAMMSEGRPALVDDVHRLAEAGGALAKAVDTLVARAEHRADPNHWSVSEESLARLNEARDRWGHARRGFAQVPTPRFVDAARAVAITGGELGAWVEKLMEPNAITNHAPGRVLLDRLGLALSAFDAVDTARIMATEERARRLRLSD